MNHLVISFITPDRPGIVDLISNAVNKHHGNWQKSSLNHMSGSFAGVVEIACADDNIQALSTELLALKGFKIQIEQAKTVDSIEQTQLMLELTANDRIGIVNEISSVIHHAGGNLLKLISSQENAPHSGQDLFKAKVTIAINSSDIDNMINALENLADDLMVDISR